MLACMPKAAWDEQDELYRNVFGYLFAKAMEMDFSRSSSAENPCCIYDPLDAWAGIFRSSLDTKRQRELEYEHARGRGYFDSFKYSYCEEYENSYVPINWGANCLAFHTLVGLQHIAEAYSGTLLK